MNELLESIKWNIKDIETEYLKHINKSIPESSNSEQVSFYTKRVEYLKGQHDVYTIMKYKIENLIDNS